MATLAGGVCLAAGCEAVELGRFEFSHTVHTGRVLRTPNQMHSHASSPRSSPTQNRSRCFCPPAWLVPSPSRWRNGCSPSLCSRPWGGLRPTHCLACVPPRFERHSAPAATALDGTLCASPKACLSSGDRGPARSAHVSELLGYQPHLDHQERGSRPVHSGQPTVLQANLETGACSVAALFLPGTGAS